MPPPPPPPRKRAALHGAPGHVAAPPSSRSKSYRRPSATSPPPSGHPRLTGDAGMTASRRHPRRIPAAPTPSRPGSATPPSATAATRRPGRHPHGPRLAARGRHPAGPSPPSPPDSRVTATEPPPIHSAAPAPSPVYTTAGDPPRPSFPDPPPARFAEPSAGRAEYPAQGATGLAPHAALEFATYDGVEDPLNSAQPVRAVLPDSVPWLRTGRGSPRTTSAVPPRCGTTPWSRTRVACLHGTGSVSSAFPLARLAELGRLAFTTTVQDFADRFQALACHAPGVTGQQRAELFIGGLPDHIRVDVELQAPRDLQTAMHYARAYERRAQAVQQTPLARGTRAARPPPPAAAATRPAPPGPAGPAPAATRTFRRLTPAEQLERRRLGLCFNCDDPYTPGHVCPRLFYLETVDVEEGDPMAGPVAAASEMAGPTDAAATAFVVSLHALAGIRHERTMLLPVTIQGEPLVALLDMGSTHNFLPAATMRRLALQPTGGDTLRVTVANGDRLHCHGVVQHVPLTIGDEHFVITCAGIDLGCFDFILGVDFLRTLGPILWDFDARR
ncbi:hypothetical protein QYE76_025502 [Lolium multiflorum]|uniref:Uncharacterized protein n=1 Tax=Lolium multiflorum TaxID=4521 RepID=A0AAD8VWR7_LOLMU|nr:hypothetical protein QYE76_025502 [Lolium multiflorum]